MPLKLVLRGEVWHYSGTVAGRRLRGTTQTTDRKKAERIAAEVEHKAWQCRFNGPGAGLTMAQVFNAYLDAKKSERFLLKLVDHFKNTLVENVRPETIRQAAKKLYPHATEPTWNRQVIKPTQAAINYAADLGWCGRIAVKRFPENPKKKTPVDLQWVTAFNEQAIEDGLPHLGALCLFMFGTGARIGESCRLTWRFVDLTAGTATLHLFKPTPWTRTAYLQPELVAALANLPSNRNQDEAVFGYAGRGSAKGPWSNVVSRAGIEQLTPHCCRHGFATTMLQAGVDPKTVAEYGGWKDATTVLRTYAHAMKDRNVTNVIFGTKLAQASVTSPATFGNVKRKV